MLVPRSQWLCKCVVFCPTVVHKEQKSCICVSKVFCLWFLLAARKIRSQVPVCIYVFICHSHSCCSVLCLPQLNCSHLACISSWTLSTPGFPAVQAYRYAVVISGQILCVPPGLWRCAWPCQWDWQLFARRCNTLKSTDVCKKNLLALLILEAFLLGANSN